MSSSLQSRQSRSLLPPFAVPWFPTSRSEAVRLAKVEDDSAREVARDQIQDIHKEEVLDAYTLFPAILATIVHASFNLAIVTFPGENRTWLQRIKTPDCKPTFFERATLAGILLAVPYLLGKAAYRVGKAYGKIQVIEDNLERDIQARKETIDAKYGPEGEWLDDLRQNLDKVKTRESATHQKLEKVSQKLDRLNTNIFG